MTPGDVKADNKGQNPRSTGVADVIAFGVDAKAWFFVAGVLLVVIGGTHVRVPACGHMAIDHQDDDHDDDVVVGGVAAEHPETCR